MQNQSLRQLLHCNAFHVEHLDHENLSLCVLSTFLTCHWRTCLFVLSVLSPLFHVTVTQSHSKYFHTEPPTLFPQRHWMTLSRQRFIVLLHTITKYIPKCLDKQWYQCPINLIAYNITTFLSIIAWHLIRDHHPVYINRKYISYFHKSL